MLVPPIRQLARNALTVLQHFDGVLLPGGGDVDPRRYGQEPDKVASIVLLGNLAAVVFLPIALALVLD